MRAPTGTRLRTARSTTSVSRRTLLSLLAVGLLVAATACRLVRDERPNIIFILVDTLRADYLGAYGFEGRVSPEMDALARESILFRNCFTQSPWTKPAVATLFTSLHPQVHGLTNHEGKYWGEATPEMRTGILSRRATTLAERLRESGYETAGFIANPWLDAAYGFDQGFDVYYDEETDFSTTARHLMDDVRAWFDAREADKPYFLYLHLMDVHAPYSASRPDFITVRQSPTLQSDHILGPKEMPDLRWHNLEIRPSWATDEMRREVAYWRARYASGVRATDRRLGLFLDYLRKRNELDSSILVLTSDHGEELFEHGDWSHGQSLFDHQLRIPLIIRNPQGRGGGVEVDTFIDLIDLMPTLLAVARAEPPEGMQGRDMSAVLEGHPVERPEFTFATATQRIPRFYSVRTARHKLLLHLDTEWQRLFEMANDGTEHEDVSAREPEVAQELRDRLLAHIRDSVAGGTLETETAEIPEELQERLRALGYLQ